MNKNERNAIFNMPECIGRQDMYGTGTDLFTVVGDRFFFVEGLVLNVPECGEATLYDCDGNLLAILKEAKDVAMVIRNYRYDIGLCI